MEKWQNEYKKEKEAIEKERVGKITSVKEMTNKEFFGDTGRYDEKNGIELTIVLEEDEDIEFTQWFSIPDKPTGIKQSNMYAFEQKYGELPKVDLLINAFIDDNGFFRVVL